MMTVSVNKRKALWLLRVSSSALLCIFLRHTQ